MPYVWTKGSKSFVMCPIYGRVEVNKCYTCPNYRFRNLKFLVCDEDAKRLFGEHYVIISKDPLRIADDSGAVWVWTKNERGSYGWFREVNGKVLFDESL